MLLLRGRFALMLVSFLCSLALSDLALVQRDLETLKYPIFKSEFLELIEKYPDMKTNESEDKGDSKKKELKVNENFFNNDEAQNLDYDPPYSSLNGQSVDENGLGNIEAADSQFDTNNPTQDLQHIMGFERQQQQQRRQRMLNNFRAQKMRSLRPYRANHRTLRNFQALVEPTFGNRHSVTNLNRLNDFEAQQDAKEKEEQIKSFIESNLQAPKYFNSNSDSNKKSLSDVRGALPLNMDFHSDYNEFFKSKYNDLLAKNGFPNYEGNVRPKRMIESKPIQLQLVGSKEYIEQLFYSFPPDASEIKREFPKNNHVRVKRIKKVKSH